MGSNSFRNNFSSEREDLRPCLIWKWNLPCWQLLLKTRFCFFCKWSIFGLFFRLVPLLVYSSFNLYCPFLSCKMILVSAIISILNFWIDFLFVMLLNWTVYGKFSLNSLFGQFLQICPFWSAFIQRPPFSKFLSVQ